MRLGAPSAGRLVVRVLDRKGRTLARGSATFRGAGTRTLRIKPVRRGGRAKVSLRWTPAEGRSETLRRSL
jgi:hypothetical protein